MYRKMSVSLYYTPIIRRKFSNQLLQLEREETNKQKEQMKHKGSRRKEMIKNRNQFKKQNSRKQTGGCQRRGG